MVRGTQNPVFHQYLYTSSWYLQQAQIPRIRVSGHFRDNRQNRPCTCARGYKYHNTWQNIIILSVQYVQNAPQSISGHIPPQTHHLLQFVNTHNNIMTNKYSINVTIIWGMRRCMVRCTPNQWCHVTDILELGSLPLFITGLHYDVRWLTPLENWP